MRALVTGGTGFIGDAICRKLLNEGHDVVVVDNMYDNALRYGIEHKIDQKRMGFVRLYPVDVEDIAHMDFGPIDVVFHIAAHYANVRSLKEPFVCMDSNMKGTMAVLEFCRINKVPRLMYASSSGAYGAMDIVAYAENMQARPSTPYEVTKYAGELLCAGFCDIYGIGLVAPRFFNVYGPGDIDGEFRAVIPRFFRLAHNNEPLVVTGEMSSRDFTYIDDVVNAVFAGLQRLSEAPKPLQLVYNISTGRETFVKKLAEMIIEITKSSSDVRVEEHRFWDNSPRRVGDTHKFRALFPEEYEAMRPIDQGLRDAYPWYKETCK